MKTVEKLFRNTYWRVDSEYLTLELAENVSDAAPVGQWIQTIGNPYAYFMSREQAVVVLKDVIDRKIAELHQIKASLHVAS